MQIESVPRPPSWSLRLPPSLINISYTVNDNRIPCQVNALSGPQPLALGAADGDSPQTGAIRSSPAPHFC